MTWERTGRWRPAAAAALFVVALGVYVADAAVLLAAVVPAAYAAYPSLVRPPSPAVSVERTVADCSPDAGEPVAVSLRVRNDGTSPLAAVAVADDQPETLGVNGDSRLATPLAPGESVTLEYEVTARYGVHEWGSPSVVVRDRSGGHETARSPVAGGDDRIECRPTVPGPLCRAGAPRSGRRASDARGAGSEFGHVREYRHGDAPARVDWRRFAATGDLRTVVSPVAQRGALVVCVDAREAAYRERAGDHPTAVAHAATAGRAVAAAAAKRGVQVGAAAFGAQFDWAAPTGGRFERSPAATVLDDRVADWQSEGRETREGWQQSLRSLLPAGATIVFSTPLSDGAVAAFARRLATDRSVVVVSPDVTRSDTAGARAARLERRHRIRTLRNEGVPVVDWRPPAPLAAAVERSRAGGGSP
ncbi:DUF58 domain-containing protein [Halobacterium jilantaiense]|uniref:Uncharacterized conserved protein, DUF58 family, contains vWF domain n=1 Tax=Halobacterium jilantaiense TaxID=355548 RepID=A0A1I0Q5X9_9EURY|nr:DUF58 domain-containing protein [Halobacterium jilantaiense]SEW22175.1 Uncharacterized conserved protein, DUF58 family, contains vWF domain [Halobacterium jilantaiense]